MSPEVDFTIPELSLSALNVGLSLSPTVANSWGISTNKENGFACEWWRCYVWISENWTRTGRTQCNAIRRSAMTIRCNTKQYDGDGESIRMR